jgi:hypothetical protein
VSLPALRRLLGKTAKDLADAGEALHKLQAVIEELRLAGTERSSIAVSFIARQKFAGLSADRLGGKVRIA